MSIFNKNKIDNTIDDIKDGAGDIKDIVDKTLDSIPGDILDKGSDIIDAVKDKLTPDDNSFGKNAGIIGIVKDGITNSIND